LSVEPERRSILSCCSATTQKIDLKWLEQNPGQLFNTPELQRERQEMLNDVAVASCEDTCWRAERQGLASRRTAMKSNVKTHTNINAEPEHLHVNFGSDCNLTCVYCTKQYSTAWLRDIEKNGPYVDQERHKINFNDKILLKLGQNEILNSSSYQFILDETSKYKNIKSMEVTGGEPFLNNQLVDLLDRFDAPKIITTGLGVSQARLTKILDQLDHNKVRFVISAENCGSAYEFVRYGNSYDIFLKNLEIIGQRFEYSFLSVVSNLTIHGFAEFERTFKDQVIKVNFCTDPNYLATNVLDNVSRNILQSTNFNNSNDDIQQTLAIPYTSEQKQNLQTFIKRFVELRKDLALDIFPQSFITWLNTP
jgi:pyruvate-formate lyase-activating enzyme